MSLARVLTNRLMNIAVVWESATKWRCRLLLYRRLAAILKEVMDLLISIPRGLHIPI